MPIVGLRPPSFKPPKEVVITWDTWRKGLNLLLRENEVDKQELVNATNLLLIGSGIPTRRWGSDTYFKSAPTSSRGNRFVLPIKDNDGNQQVLALSTWGILVKKSGTSYTTIDGASWPSGSQVEATQLGEKIYLVSKDREFVRYDFSSLTSFPTIFAPSSITATNLSGVSVDGIRTVSWGITSVSKSGGETEPTRVSLPTLPQNLNPIRVRLNWPAVSAASGDLVGYNIYRGTPGDETWLGGVDSNTTTFEDFGTPTNLANLAPSENTTGGHKAKYIIRYQDRLILAGFPGDPTKVMVSGRWPYQERFDFFGGGSVVWVEPESGEDITGLGIYQEKLVVFKENSVWQIGFENIPVEGVENLQVALNLNYQLLTASQGCSSHRSIIPVENDLMFCNRKGIYILRYEPQLLTILNANEISAKIKPFFDSLSEQDLVNASAVYADKKYVVSFPISKQSIIFDRERLSFMGPWPTPYGISHWAKYVDSLGTERWLAADYDDNEISEFRKSFNSDKGSPINTIFKSRREDFADWTLFKTLNEVYMNFRGLVGTVSVNLYIEERSGRTIVAKAFDIVATGTSGTSGFGNDQFGTVPFGLSNFVASVLEDETPLKSFIYKSTRTFQAEVRTNGRNDNYELLGIKAVAIPQSRGNSPSSWVV